MSKITRDQTVCEKKLYNSLVSPLEIFSLLNLEARELAVNKDNSEFITLREAAELSGYSSDYIGQLIRSGKLEGKQVFSNVSWVTTRDAVIEYSLKEKKSAQDVKTRKSEKFAVEVLIGRMYTVLGWAVVVVLSVVALVLIYIFAVSVDHKINANYLEQIQYAR